MTDEKKQKYLEKFFELIKIPSISALPEHHGDVLRAAEFITKELEALGFKNISYKYAKGHEDMAPVIYAERIDDPENPTIIVYCHYDVQPVDPIENWTSDPFNPTIVDNYILARGASDSKSHIMAQLFALQELSEEWGEKWPVNIRFVMEGQEESGGENIEAWMKEPETKELLKGDVFVVNDSHFATETIPAITYGLRGIAYFQINVRLGSTDLHSGEFGGGILNPINALAYILTKLYDVETGKVLIPGFYGDVIDVSEEERANLAKVPFTEEDFLKDAGSARSVWGDTNYSTKERISARPTFDANGIWGGFSGNGAKTIIPNEAHVKFSTRLVPNQKPEKIKELVMNYIPQIAPKGVEVEVEYIHGGNGIMTDVNSPWVQMEKEALEEVYGVEPVFDRGGGSIPLSALIQSEIGVEPLLIGIIVASDNAHAPNEKVHVDRFFKYIESRKSFYKKAAKVRKNQQNQQV